MVSFFKREYPGRGRTVALLVKTGALPLTTRECFVAYSASRTLPRKNPVDSGGA